MKNPNAATRSWCLPPKEASHRRRARCTRSAPSCASAGRRRSRSARNSAAPLCMLGTTRHAAQGRHGRRRRHGLRIRTSHRIRRLRRPPTLGAQPLLSQAYGAGNRRSDAWHRRSGRGAAQRGFPRRPRVRRRCGSSASRSYSLRASAADRTAHRRVCFVAAARAAVRSMQQDMAVPRRRSASSAADGGQRDHQHRAAAAAAASSSCHAARRRPRLHRRAAPSRCATSALHDRELAPRWLRRNRSDGAWPRWRRWRPSADGWGEVLRLGRRGAS